MTVRPRTILLVLGIAVLVGLVLFLVLLAWHVLTWILIAALLAAALNPAVEAFERRGMRRGYAASLVFALALLALTGDRLPRDPSARHSGQRLRRCRARLHRRPHGGRGPLGWLQDEYQIVDRIREAIEEQGAGGVLGLGEPFLDVVRSIVTAVVGTITIIFLTYFMLLEGPRTADAAARPASRDVPAALRARRARHLQDDLRLRHRESAHQRHRRDARDDRPLRRRQRLRGRARPRRGGARPHPARGRDDRGDHRLDRRLHRGGLASLPHRHRASSSRTSSSRTTSCSRSCMEGRSSSRPLPSCARC